jgi:hypothetical protein
MALEFLNNPKGDFPIHLPLRQLLKSAFVLDFSTPNQYFLRFVDIAAAVILYVPNFTFVVIMSKSYSFIILS